MDVYTESEDDYKQGGTARAKKFGGHCSQS